MSTTWQRRLSRSVPSVSMFAAAWKRARVSRIMRNSKNLSLRPKVPDRRGHFGPYGGRYVAETLMPALAESSRLTPKRGAICVSERTSFLSDRLRRPRNAALFCRAVNEKLGGAKIYLKREDLCHTGAHKINNASARHCWRGAWARSASSPKPARASTASRPRRCARASACSAKSTWARKTCAPGAERLSHEVARRRGRSVEAGSRTLKDAINEALRDWVTNVRSTYYLIGSVARAASVPDDGARFSIGHRP